MAARDSVGAVQDRPAPTAARSSSVWSRAAVLLVWLFGLDVWIKYVARLGACAPSSERSPWSLPEQCERVDIAAGMLAVLPAVRPGVGPIVMSSLLERQLGSLALLALTTIMTITVARARVRNDADVLAIACVWAGALVWSGPCLLGPGVGLTEIVVAGTPTGIGDLALVFGVAWLLLGWLRD